MTLPAPWWAGNGRHSRRLAPVAARRAISRSDGGVSMRSGIVSPSIPGGWGDSRVLTSLLRACQHPQAVSVSAAGDPPLAASAARRQPPHQAVPPSGRSEAAALTNAGSLRVKRSRYSLRGLEGSTSPLTRLTSLPEELIWSSFQLSRPGVGGCGARPLRGGPRCWPGLGGKSQPRRSSITTLPLAPEIARAWPSRTAALPQLSNGGNCTSVAWRCCSRMAKREVRS